MMKQLLHKKLHKIELQIEDIKKGKNEQCQN